MSGIGLVLCERHAEKLEGLSPTDLLPFLRPTITIDE